MCLVENNVLSVAATGHRPDRIGGWDNEQAFTRLTDLAVAVLRRLVEQNPGKTIRVISGMAQGWDMAWAVAGLRLRNRDSLPITVCAAIPYASQPDSWYRNRKVQRLWQNIVDACDEKHILAPNPQGKWEAAKLLNDRNLWMVQQADMILALWNGDHPSVNGKKSGTGNCVMDARKLNKPVLNVWDSWVKYGGIN